MNILRFKPKEKKPVHRLPFVGGTSQRGCLNHWDVPESGEFGAGWEVGKALAVIYLKHIRKHKAGLLPHIALDMLWGDILQSREGQAIGFFSVLDTALEGYAKYLNNGLDGKSEHDLLALANGHLSGSVVSIHRKERD